MLLVFAITPTVSRFSKSLFLGSLSAVLTWFIVVNGAVWFAGGGSLPQTYIAAIPFDFRLAVSTGLYVALFHSSEKLCMSFSRSNIKLLDRLV